MRNSLLSNVCCCEVVKSFSRLESNSLTFLQLVFDSCCACGEIHEMSLSCLSHYMWEALYKSNFIQT